jgi:hypothetical protein
MATLRALHIEKAKSKAHLQPAARIASDSLVPLLLPLQSLVDLPPEVARVANQAAATGGQVLGK